MDIESASPIHSRPMEATAVLGEQTELLYRMSPFGLSAAALVAVLISYGIYPVVPRALLLVWVLGTLGIVAGQGVLYLSYAQHGRPVANAEYWLRYFSVGAILQGLCWGLLPLLLFPYASALHQAFILVALACISVISVIALAPVKWLYPAYILPSAVVITIQASRQADQLHSLLGIFALTLSGFSLGMALILHRSVLKYVYAGHRNRQLEAELASSQHLIEGATQRLAQAIAEHQDVVSELQSASSLLDALMASSPLAITLHDSKARIVRWSPAAERILGWREGEILGRDPPHIPEDRREEALHYREMLLRGDPFINVETVRVRKDGAPVQLAIWGARLTGRDGHPLGYMTISDDITRRKEAEVQIRQLAEFDGLTGLVNRRLMLETIASSIAQAGRSGAMLAVLFIDLDLFKNINDRLGHHAGDELLKHVALRLQDCVRKTDKVARQGGDEFIILLNVIKHESDAANVATKILQTLARPVHIEGNELYVSASVGISVFPRDGDTADALIKRADMGMYQAKDLGRNRFQFFTQLMNEQLSQRLQLEEKLRSAIERNEFVVYYQPQYDVCTGELVGAEALLRWNQPDIGTVSSAAFIAIAEETGLIVPLGRWILRRVLEQGMDWRKRGLKAITLSVNLSARQFKDPDLRDCIIGLLDETSFPREQLELEIAEGLLMEDTDSTISLLRGLKAAGIRIAIDDFGTGHSSLGYLRRFAIDTIKIDQAFVCEISAVREDTAIVTAIIAMGQSLGLRVVAQGVETTGQLKFLKSRGCNVAQGYFMCRPLTAPMLTKLLDADDATELPPAAGA